MPPRPGDPDYLDWLISQAQQGGTPATRPAATPTAAPSAPQPTGGRTSTPAPTPTGGGQRFPTAQENAQTRYGQMVAAGRQGGYAFARDLEAEGFVRLASGNYVNPRTGEEFSPVTTTAVGEPIFQKNSFGANTGERQEAARLAAAPGVGSRTAPGAGGGISALVPQAQGPIAPGGFFPTRAGFEQAAQAAGGRIPGQLVPLGREIDSLRNFERYGPATTGLNVYDSMTRGGPGRAGFTSMIRGWEAGPGGRSPFQPLPAGVNLRDSLLIEPEGYGGPSGRDFYATGEPMVATTYGGQPATLSTGTAGAEIRGGTAGGWGGDAGAILAAHGIGPSGDPLVDAAAAAEIMSGYGQVQFQGGGEINYDGGGSLGEAYGGRTGDPGQEYVFGGGGSATPYRSYDPYNPAGPPTGGSFGDYIPSSGAAGGGGYAPVTSGTSPGSSYQGRLPPPQIPLPAPAADPWALPNVPRTGLPQRQQYFQNLYGYRRQAGGLPQMRALELAAGEIPTGPAPAGFYYLSPDYGAAVASLAPQIAAIGEGDLSSSLAAQIGALEENLSNLNLGGGTTPEIISLQNQIATLEAQLAASGFSSPGSTLDFQVLQQLRDQLTAAQTAAAEVGADAIVVQQAADMRAQLSTLRDHYNRARAREELQRQADLYATYAAAPNQYTGGFAHGGEIGMGGSRSPYGAMVMPQADGRKSMVVPEPSLIVGQRTGTPYGQMSEAGAEVLSDQGNSLRIDPMSRLPAPQPAPLPDLPPSEFTWLLRQAPDVAASLAQLDLSVMRKGNVPASQLEMALGKVQSIVNPAARTRAEGVYRNIIGRLNSTRPTPSLSEPMLPTDPVALAAATKFGKVAA